MKKMTIEQFKEESNMEMIMRLLNVNKGYVTSKMISELGIHRMYLNILKDKGLIEKVGTGIYIDSNKIEDLYFIFSLEYPNVVFSHMTALYFHDLSIKAPTSKYDITVRSKYNNQVLKEHNVFYVDDDVYQLGLTEIETPMGNKVKVYDMERCICDIVRSRKRMDTEHVKYSIKEYLKRKDKNLNNLSLYAEKMGIKREVIEFVSLMYE